MSRSLCGISHEQCDSHRAHAARHGRYCAGYFADAFKIDIAAKLAVFVPVHADINDRRAGLYHIRSYHFALPTAAIRISAFEVNEARFSVLEWQTVTVEFSLSMSIAMGLPTILLLPTITQFLPAVSIFS